MKKFNAFLDERCWPGYKSVPGKKAYAKGSCVKEDLRRWFSKTDPEGGWKRINSKGEAIGPCAREPGEAKPKCMSNEKRAQLTKKERASAVAAKRRNDPNPERKGKPINVSNFGKGKISEDMENLEEKNVPTSPEKWAQAKAQAKAKFDVYPSAYANGWAAKKYKEMGGGWKTASESVQSFKSFISEGRPSQRHPLEGHEYHKKTDAELVHIAKDAHKAAEAMKGHNTNAENKYRDQANDSATVRYFRQKSGMPDWYKKKYGHVKEEVVAEGWRATGGQDNAGGQSYGIDNSDGTIGRGYKPGKHYSSSSSTVEIKSEPKHPLHGKQVTNGKVTGRLMGTEHQGTVAKIKHSSGMIHHVDAKEIRKIKEEVVAEGSYKTYQPKHVAWVVRHGDGKVSEFKPHEDDAANAKYDQVKGNRGASIYAIDQHSQSIPMGSLRALRKKQGVAEEVEQIDEVAAWQRKEGKNPEGGLNRKGIASYRAEHPSSKLSMAVTTKPSKLKPGSKAANRRKSFCARMSGMKKRLTSAKTAHDPDSRINKSLRKWNC